jgi:ABC-type molybdenum transport system ATPase subunit/photorepair protein PhrA
MKASVFKISKLEGYSGIRLRNEKPLNFRSGINLMVGRNGCGKTNLLRLIQQICSGKGDANSSRIESSFLLRSFSGILGDENFNWNNPKFPRPKIASFTFNGKKGNIELELTRVDKPYILRNLLGSGKNGGGLVQMVYNQNFSIPYTYVYPNQSIPKFEATGHLLNTTLLSYDSNSKAHEIIKEPIQVVSSFIRKGLIEFFGSNEFRENIMSLEATINNKFAQFLGSTDKTVCINYDDIKYSGQVLMSLKDKDNFINSEDLSTGEAVLFNLIFSLISAKAEKTRMLILDEPEIHMHDDMIQVLANELVEVHRVLPDCIIVLATHSTSLIEKLALLGEEIVNVITFDPDRKVGNSKKEIDLINTLERNGVKFTPLMLSRRKNIFIENQQKNGRSHKEFFLKFFSFENQPNIIPIGSSGNVEENESFKSVFQEILKTSSINSLGIQDGDIWFKQQLNNYLLNKIELAEFKELLRKNKGVYIMAGKEKPNLYYFNFWEIENLYLMPELVHCWSKESVNLSIKEFNNIVIKAKPLIFRSYMDTFLKTNERLRIATGSIEKAREKLKLRFESIDLILSKEEQINKKLNLLMEFILSKAMVNWLPGKEIKFLLERKGYQFNDKNFNFNKANISKQIRKIMNGL